MSSSRGAHVLPKHYPGSSNNTGLLVQRGIALSEIKKIPFSPPDITQEEIEVVVDTLRSSRSTIRSASTSCTECISDSL